jgi:hypothetical protein
VCRFQSIAHQEEAERILAEELPAKRLRMLELRRMVTSQICGRNGVMQNTKPLLITLSSNSFAALGLHCTLLTPLHGRNLYIVCDLSAGCYESMSGTSLTEKFIAGEVACMRKQFSTSSPMRFNT